MDFVVAATFVLSTFLSNCESNGLHLQASSAVRQPQGFISLRGQQLRVELYIVDVPEQNGQPGEAVYPDKAAAQAIIAGAIEAAE